MHSRSQKEYLELGEIHWLHNGLDKELLDEGSRTLRSRLFHVERDEHVGVDVLAFGVLQGTCHLKHGGHAGPIVVVTRGG